MILPTKHVPEEQTLLGLGMTLLALLERPQTVTSLWERARVKGAFSSFERFVLALDLLHILRVIDLSNGVIVKERS